MTNITKVKLHVNEQFSSGIITSSEMLNQFEYCLQARGLNQNTIYNYKTAIQRFPSPVTKNSAIDYLIGLYGKRSSGYINYQVRVLKAYGKCFNLGWIDDITYVTGDVEYEKKVLPVDVLQRILAFDPKEHKIKQSRPYLWEACSTALWVLTTTGCRPSEALKLTKDDYDPVGRYLTFRKTKTKNSRTIPIDKSLCDILDDWVKNCPFDNLFFDPKYGRPILARQLLKNFDRRLKYLDYRKTRGVDVYCLRHTFISVMAKKMSSTQGTSIKDLQDLVGHKLLSTTEKYLHTDLESLRLAIGQHPMAQEKQSLPEVFQEATNWFVSFFHRFNPHIVVKDYDDSDPNEVTITYQVKIKKAKKP